MMNLKDLAQQEMEKTAPVILNFPWENKYAYAMWLAQTHYMVSHSTRLVAMAGAYVPVGQEQLHARFVDHSKEERGHQLVCIQDVKALGYQLSDFPQLYQSAAMYQVQYYWIQHHGPASFFGYTLALECLAEKFGPEVTRRVVSAHGDRAAKFLKLHAEADQDHTEEAYEAIAKIPESQLQPAYENLILSAEIYRAMLNESATFSERMGGRAAS